MPLCRGWSWLWPAPDRNPRSSQRGLFFPPGRPKEKTAPSASSAVHAVTSVGAIFPPGRPKQGTAPEGLEPAVLALPAQGRTGDRGEASHEPRPARPRAVHAVTSVGAIFPPGRPKEKTAPSGGSAVHAVTSVGATYVGRFAPSPTGPLHAGSLVAALASWLDARAWNGGVGGRWLIRMEDLDTARCVPGAAAQILRQLQDCGLLPDQPPVFQSQRLRLYQQALEHLMASARVYPCACSRQDIERELVRLGRLRPRHGELVYPGTCRQGSHGKPALAWRFLVEAPRATPLADRTVSWIDRCRGPQQQDVLAEVGDFVVLRADGPFAYQLAVVVDDAAQHITHVVRGEDLCDNTARQILLQRALGLSQPQYLHTPLVLAASGEKFSKQSGAMALDTSVPLRALNAAAAALGLAPQAGSTGDALVAWVGAWRSIYNPLL